MEGDYRGAVLRQVHRIFSRGTVSGMSEGQLLEHFLARRDEAAFEAIVVRHAPMVWGVCRRLLRNPHDAEDAFQATFLVLLRRAASLRDPGQLSPWLYGVAFRVASRAQSDVARRRERERRAARAEAVGHEFPHDAARLRDAIDEEVSRLPEKYRVPLLLCHMEGLSYEEAARRLRSTSGAVKGRLARARERLRSRLTRRGLAPSVGLPLAWLSSDVASAEVPPALVAMASAVASGLTAGGTAATAAVPGPVITLADGVLKAMFLSKLKTAACLVVGAIVLAALPLALARAGKATAAPEPPAGTASQAPAARATDPARQADRPAHSMEVRAVDRRTGSPLGDVELDIRIDNAKDEGRTDAAGRALIAMPAGGPNRLVIKAKKGGFVPLSVTWDRRGTAPVAVPETFRLAMEPGTSIGGVVQDPEGRPIAGATVFLLVPSKVGQGEPRPDIWDYSVRTDDRGRWHADVLPAELRDVWIRLAHRDYLSDTRYGSTAKPPMAGLRDGTGVMVMKKGLPVAGSVVDQGGRPIAGAGVAQGRSRPGGHDPEVKADAEGRFRFDHVAPGDLVLTVQAPGFAPDVKALKVVPGMSPVEFRLGPGRVVRGRVVDPEGKPVTGAWVVADEWRGFRSLALKTETDAEGRFRVADAPADPVLFQFYKPEFMNLPGQALTASDDEHSVRMIRPLTVRGSVTDAETGRPIDAFVLLVGGDPTSNQPRWDRDETYRPAGGRYELRFTWPYPQVRGLRVEAEGYLPAVSRGFSSTEGDQTYDFRLTRGSLARRPALTGIVRLPDGSPASGAELRLATKSQGMYIKGGRDLHPDKHPTTRADADGRFAFPPQTEPALVLVLDDRGFARLTEDQLIAAPTVMLRPWGRVEGTLRVGGKPGPFEEVVLMPKPQAGPRDEWTHYDFRANTDASGRFTLSRVVPGEAKISRGVKLSANSVGFGPWMPLEVKAGETVQVAVGGTGRAVVGRLVKPAGWDLPVDWTKAFHTLRLKIPKVPMPQGLTKEQRAAWYREWIETDEGKAYLEARRSDRFYPVKVEPDGSFRIDDVAPGAYDLSIRVDGPTDQGPRRVARATRTVEVVETRGGREDEPIDMGKVELVAEGAPAR